MSNFPKVQSSNFFLSPREIAALFPSFDSMSRATFLIQVELQYLHNELLAFTKHQIIQPMADSLFSKWS